MEMGRVNLHCINCGHKQSEGKYCAACGTALSNEVIGAELTRSKPIGKSDTGPNEYVEKVKMVIQNVLELSPKLFEESFRRT